MHAFGTLQVLIGTFLNRCNMLINLTLIYINVYHIADSIIFRIFAALLILSFIKMVRQVRIKVSSSSGKTLFERYIPCSVSDIPYSILIDAMECLFDGIPHTTEFIIDVIKPI